MRGLSRLSAQRSIPAKTFAVAAAVLFLLQIPQASPEETTAPLRELTIAAVGDIMLGGTAAPELARFGYDYPFERVASLIRKADLAFANLEGPLTDRGQAQRKQYVFRSPPDLVASALARAGFDVVSLANNHSMDYGIEGLRDTMRALARAGIAHAGAGGNLAVAREPAYLDADGKHVAVLAYSLTFPEEFWASDARPGTAFGHEDQVRADVAAARNKAGTVIVSFHWGQEGSIELRDYQRKLGHAAIDAGAAAVIGHHPHVLQGVERYGRGVILYSLGNFVFGSYSPGATRSAIAVLSIRQGRVRELKLYPINVKNAEVVFQPYVLSGAPAAEVVQHISQLSQPLGAMFENHDGVAVLHLADDAK